MLRTPRFPCVDHCALKRALGFVAPLLGLLLAGCPTEVGVQCPPHTVSVGQFTLGLTGLDADAGGSCAATLADGGSPTPLTLADAGQLGATFCLGTGGSDGGPQLTFLAPGKGQRTSDLLPDAGFHFTGHSDPVAGNTACVCSVAIDESFDGNLVTTPPGPVSLQADGGLPLITGITGTIKDSLPKPSDTTGCLCALPCTVTYAVSGSRF